MSPLIVACSSLLYGKTLIVVINLVQLAVDPVPHRVYDVIGNFQALLPDGKFQVSYPPLIEKLIQSANFTRKSVELSD